MTDERFWEGGDPVLPVASKKEAQARLNAARTKAQHAHERRTNPADQIDMDAAKLHYERCVRELEEAINDMARFETGDDD